MIKRMLLPIAGFFSLALAVSVQHTSIFLVDFTETPEPVQLLVSWSFILLFGFFMLTTGWTFYESAE